MRAQILYSASAIALMTAVTFAQAQNTERQTQEPSTKQEQGPEQKSRGETPSYERKTQSNKGVEGKGEEREKTGQAGEEERAKKPKSSKAAEENKSTQERTGETGKSGERAEKREQSGTSKEGTDRNAAGEQQRERQGEQGRGTEASGHEKGRVTINVPAEQKSKVRGIVGEDKEIHRLSRSDLRGVEPRVGVRIPETITFYSPPPQLVTIVPDLRRYKIIVLEDEILVVDPATREIVDVIYV